MIMLLSTHCLNYTLSRVVCYLFCLLTPALLWAETAPQTTDTMSSPAEPPAAEGSCRDPDIDAADWWDRMHGYINENLCIPVAWFDGFFGDERSEELSPVNTYFRWRTTVRWDELEGTELSTRFHADVKLPRASSQLRLLISREDDLDDLIDQDDINDTDNSPSTQVGLRYTVLTQPQQRFTVSAGVHTGFPPDPFVRGRYRYVHPLGERTQFRVTETAYWEREDGFGLNNRLDWEWYYQPQTLIRWTGSATVSEVSEGVDWSSALTAFHQLDTRRALRWEAGINGHTEPDDDDAKIEEYYVNMRYRFNYFRSWLFFELQPEVAWPTDDYGDREFSMRFLTTLEIQFSRQ